jgi:hypothetical protein
MIPGGSGYDTRWQWLWYPVAVVMIPGGSGYDTRWQWLWYPVAVVIYSMKVFFIFCFLSLSLVHSLVNKEL